MKKLSLIFTALFALTTIGADSIYHWDGAYKWLPIGSAGQVLRVGTNVLYWGESPISAPVGTVVNTSTTAAGNILLAADATKTNVTALGGLPGKIPMVNSAGAFASTNFGSMVGLWTNGTTVIVFEGESNMSGVGASTATNRFSDRLFATYLNALGNFVYGTNAAVSGSQLTSYQTNATNHLIYAHRPQGATNSILVFAGGGNDLVALKSVDTIFAAWTNYILWARGYGFKIVGTTLPPFGTATAAVEVGRVQLNYKLREHSYLVDWFYDVDAAIQGPPSVFHTTDLIHWDNDGHGLIATDLYVLLRMGLGSSYPMFGRNTPKGIFYGNGNNARGAATTIEGFAASPGLMLHQDNALNTGRFMYWSPAYTSGAGEEFFHDGTGNITLAADIVRRLTTTAETHFKNQINLASESHSVGAGGSITLGGTNNTYLQSVDGATTTLTNAVGNRGLTFTVKTTAPAVSGTIATTSSQMIDGATTYSLTGSNAFVRVISDGTNWWTIGKGGPSIGADRYSAYAAGTVYSLTDTPALIDFGTTDPTITISVAGTYLIQANVGLKYNGATFAGNQSAVVKLRRTNNTPADITSASRTVTLGVVTGLTGSVETTQVPPVFYTASAGDIIQVFGSLSATPSAGSVDSDSAEIVALRIQ